MSRRLIFCNFFKLGKFFFVKCSSGTGYYQLVYSIYIAAYAAKYRTVLTIYGDDFLPVFFRL